MSVEVVMPQMGESITEGTVSRWLKNVGDAIEKDEPILEISTDKVDAEVPSPTAGVLLAINVGEGETVEVGTALAVVGESGETPKAAAKPEAPAQPAEPEKISDEKLDEAGADPEQPAAVPVPQNFGASPSSDGSGAVEVVMPQMGESIT